MTLAGRIRQEQALDVSGQGFVFRWYAFGETSLAETFARYVECRVEEIKRESYRQEDGGRLRLPLGALSSCLSERIAVNPPFAKVSYFAERNIGYFSLYAGVLATAALLIAIVFFFQAGTIRANAAAMRAETQKVAAAANRQAAESPLPPDFPATRAFIDLLSAARLETDPGDLLRNLRAAAGDDISLTRIHMQPDDRHIIIEGWIDTTAGDRQLAGFLARLRRLGFEPEAVDAAFAARARPGSAFAYRLYPVSRAKGKVL
jgi:hypothetical protein